MSPAVGSENNSKGIVGQVHAISESLFNKGLSFYAWSLKICLDHKPLVMLGFVLMVIATGFLVSVVPKGFLPSEDIGQIFGMTEANQGISFSNMAAHQKAMAEIVGADPNVSSYMSSIGAGGPNAAGNTGRIFIVLKPKNQRKLKVDAIINQLRKKTTHIPGIKLYLQNLGSLRIGGQLTKAMYQFSLSSPDLESLYSASNLVETKLRKMPKLIDVNSDLQIRNLEVDLQIDREKCSQLGVTMQQVEDALNSAYSARQVSTIYAPEDQYWVIVEVEPQFYRSPNLLNKLYLRTATGTLVPLSTFAKIKNGVGPLLVNHLGQFPSVTISFNLKPGVSLGEAVDEVKKLVTNSGLPPEVTPSFQGNAQIFQTSQNAMGLLLMVSVIVIYIVLGILYESYIHPITILSGLPSAGLGALLVLYIFHVEFTIYAFLGLILLIGIIKKNAIMIIDFALESERIENKTPREAIYEACLTRFRPIIMTTLAAMMGSIPIAVGLGSGSEARQPLGLTVTGGLLVSQIVTLYITPVFYIYLDRLQKFVIKTWHRFVPPRELVKP